MTPHKCRVVVCGLVSPNGLARFFTSSAKGDIYGMGYVGNYSLVCVKDYGTMERRIMEIAK